MYFSFLEILIIFYFGNYIHFNNLFIIIQVRFSFIFIIEFYQF